MKGGSHIFTYAEVMPDKHLKHLGPDMFTYLEYLRVTRYGDLCSVFSSGNIEALKYIMTIGSLTVDELRFGDCHALWLSASNGKLDMLKYLVALLLRHGRCPDKVMNDIFVSRCFQAAARDGHIEVLKYLIDYGFRIESIREKLPKSPPYFFVIGKHTPCVKYLMDLGCTIEHRHLLGRRQGEPKVRPKAAGQSPAARPPQGGADEVLDNPSVIDACSVFQLYLP
jgi:hypothetical protein